VRQSHLIISNAAGMWLSQALAVIPPLILVPYLIKTIGEVGYGVYALTWSLVMSIDQLERSLQSGVVKYSAGFLTKGLTDEVNKVISSSFVYSIFLAIIASIAVIIAAYFYNDTSGKVGISLIVVGIMILFILPLTPYIAIIQSKQRYYINAFADTAAKYITLLIVVTWFTVVRPSVEALIIITAIMLFFARFVQVPIAYRLVPDLQNNLKLFNQKSFKLIFSFGAATVLASACLAVNHTGVRWLMDYLASTSFVAHLAIILMPIALLSQIIGAVTLTLMPAASGYEAQGNYKMIQELLIRSIRYTTILIIAAFIAAFFLMRDVLIFWVGHNYAFLAPYAIILFASAAFAQTTSSAHHMLKGLGKLRAVVIIYLISLVVIPIGTILCIMLLYNNPYIAVTAGLSAGFIVCGIMQIFTCAKSAKADLKSLFQRSYIQPIIVAVFVFFVAFGAYSIIEYASSLLRLLTACIAIAAFIICCYIFIATPDEKQQFSELMKIAKSKITKVK